MLPRHCHHAVAVARVEDLVVARLTAERLAVICGLAPDHKHRLDLIVAELGSNLVRHAHGGGMMLFRCLADPGGLECICLDHGPGIADPDHALRDGQSSDCGLGLGLGTVRRLSDVFALHSMPGVGTAVLARVCEQLPSDVSGLEVGAVMVPMAGLTDCGDGWVRTDGGVVAVIDGLGHGEPASRAARRAEAAVLAGGDNPASVLEAIHVALHGTRGAVAAVAVATPDRIRFAGVGNIGAFVIGPATRTGLNSVWGVLGANARRAPVQEAAWSSSDVLVMHSDGIGRVAEVFTERHLHFVNPTLAAAVVLRDGSARVDDQTVLVLAQSPR